MADLFSLTFLPSHDQYHHMRVWKICKYLLLELETYDSVADEATVEALLLASCFHDAGMAYDTGERHGLLGSEIFARFIGENKLPEPILHREILEAIALHDSKDPALYRLMKPGNPPDLLGLLSMADDLDALGRVGIYRYLEIYLQRGIPLKLLGTTILANVRKRYNNICESTAAFPRLAALYLEDFRSVEAFFNRYNQQLTLGINPDKIRWGELGVVQHIRDFTHEERIRPEDFSQQGALSGSGKSVISFFKRLQNELEEKKP